MGLAILFDTEEVPETAVQVPISRCVRRNEVPRQHGPYEIDDEELARLLAELPEPSPVPSEMLASAEEAEISSLCFL